MSIKDKLVICLMILLVFMLAIFIKSDAASGNVMGQTTDKGLAVLAKDNINQFINTEVNQAWFDQILDSHIGKTGNDSTIAQTSATCLYEQQSYTSGSEYKITNIIDLNWNKDLSDYNVVGHWNGGSGEFSLSGQNLGEVNKFLQAMNKAYETEKKTSGGNILYTTTEKSAMKTLFYKAIDNGGFLNQDGVLNISSDFVQKQNGESMNYKDDQSTYTAGDLISEYGQNLNIGYGIQNNSPDENGDNITSKQKDQDNNYTIFGPFNMYFYEKIRSIHIKGDAGTRSGVNGGEIYYSTSFNVYEDAEWSNKLNEIPSDTNFYIKVPDGDQTFFEQSSNIAITFNQESITTYQGRFILLQVADGSGQNLMIYAASKNTPYSPSITYNVTTQVDANADLIVEKQGSQEETLVNVEFRLGTGQAEAECATWGATTLEEDGTRVYSNITYNDWDDSLDENNLNHQTFITGSNGRFKVVDLNIEYTYLLQEMHNENPGYENIDIKTATLTNGVANIQIGNTVANSETKNLVSGIKLSSTQDNILSVIDKSDENGFDIQINKINKDKELLPGAEFKILVYDGTQGIGWLQYDEENGEYYYESDYDNSTTWNTSEGTYEGNIIYSDEEGIITIWGLDSSYRYMIYEFKEAYGCKGLQYQAIDGIKVTVEGEASGSVTTTSGKNNYISASDNIDARVHCATVSSPTNGKSVIVEVTNVEQDTGGGGRRRRSRIC